MFLFYETSEGNSLRSWHLISPNHFCSKIFSLALLAPYTDLAAGIYWVLLLGVLLLTLKAGFGKRKRHLFYWKTSSYFILWKRNVNVNVLKKWLSYIKMSVPKGIVPDAQSHSHPEWRWQMETLSFERKQICELLSICLLANTYPGNLSWAHQFKDVIHTSARAGRKMACRCLDAQSV